MTEEKTKKRSIGRPSIYSKAVADAICLRLQNGESIRSICKDPGLPSRRTVLNWLNSNESFLRQYENAKIDGLESLAEEMIDIADNGTNDWMDKNDPENPGYSYNGEHVQRSRLRLDTRKWLLSKLLFKKYGDKLDVNHGGQQDNPLLILAKAVQGSALPVKSDDD
jgi:hypothetical protein